MTDLRHSPRASLRFGPVTVVWLDLWTNRYGLSVEIAVTRRRRVFAAFGFGRRFEAGRGWA